MVIQTAFEGNFPYQQEMNIENLSPAQFRSLQLCLDKNLAIKEKKRKMEEEEEEEESEEQES